MLGWYDPKLVALSLVVAIIASCTALELAGRVSTSRGRSAWIWLFGGALSMGIGIWSMHFIGMLAFHLPIPVAYDGPITLLSLFIAVVVSGVALLVIKRDTLTKKSISVGAMLMGSGICAMHYTGMIAMQMSPSIEYDPLLFVASVLIAIAASLAALWIAFKLRQKYSLLALLAKLGSAVVMGLAITGMHYTGMAAAQFAPDSICLAADSTRGMDTATLAMIIGMATLGILFVTMGISALDAHFAVNTAKLANSLQAANEQLQTVALYDSLTQLPNRMLLGDRMGQAIAHAKRTESSFALMFVDLDRFKPVNDSFGHAVGDELLKSVARRLKCCVRNEDTVARNGGDEFVIVLSEVNNIKDAAKISRKIVEALNRPFHIGAHELGISCSIGISVYPVDGQDIHTLLANADTAMYRAKKEGRNAYKFFMSSNITPVSDMQ
jgi:diguanylate cyclase (GGDEF)-like protein